MEIDSPVMALESSEVKRLQFPPRIRKKIVNTVKELHGAFYALRDPGYTFVWEMFAGKFMISRVSANGGRFVGQPLELELGIDLSDPDTVQEVVAMVETMKPWLLVAGFPCSPWSALQRLNVARARKRHAVPGAC